MGKKQGIKPMVGVKNTEAVGPDEPEFRLPADADDVFLQGVLRRLRQSRH